MKFVANIEAYIRKHAMIAPGGRVGVAVSGGADSVALLRVLVELRGELGCVLAVVHFNHKIRAEASEQDAAFVERLAQGMGLEFFGGEGDAKKFASQQRVSLETAGRELRYGYFQQLTSGAKAPIQKQAVTARLKPRPYERFATEEQGEPLHARCQLDKIATAHTLDDQAETVLMKVLRGAGTRGLSGIWPCVRRQEAGGRRQEKRTAEDGCATHIIRPMLGTRRRDVEAYLRALGQKWQEDASNRDVKHTRNKVRHELLPLLEAEYNPNIYQQLADAAEVARAEEEYWADEIRRQEKQHSALSTQHSEKQVPRSARDDNFRKQQAAGRRQEKQHSALSLQHSEEQVPRSARDGNFRKQQAGGRRQEKQHSAPSSQHSENQNADPSTREERSLGMTSVVGYGGFDTAAGDPETRHAASLRVNLLLDEPVALRRRLVREAFEQVSGKTLDFEHTDALVRFLERRESSLLQLPERWFAVLDWPRRTVRFEERAPVRKAGTGRVEKASKKQGTGSGR